MKDILAMDQLPLDEEKLFEFFLKYEMYDSYMTVATRFCCICVSMTVCVNEWVVVLICDILRPPHLTYSDGRLK